MKIKIVNLSLTNSRDKLKVCIGNLNDFLQIKFSSSLEVAIKKCPEKTRVRFEKSRGLTSKIDSSKDPDRCSVLVWINEATHDKDVVLVHELIHVKQFVEDRMAMNDEPWPHELEAYFVSDLFTETKTILN